MKTKPTANLLLLLTSVLFLFSCHVTKKLPPGEALLIKNKIDIDVKGIDLDELHAFIQQEPNSKLFGMFRTNIMLYNWGSKGKDSKFKKWLRNSVGSAPVLLDTTLSSIAMKHMALYMNNVGYFNSALRDSVIIKKKKATVHFIIRTKTPYRIRKLTYTVTDKQLAAYLFRDTSGSLIRRGDIYNSYTLDQERTRITKELRNYGYYQFATGFIIYHVDSLVGMRKMDINIEITNPVVPSIMNLGTFEETPHRRFQISNIYINTDYIPLRSDTMKYDTLVRQYRESKNDTSKYTYYYLYSGKLKIKPRTIAQSIFIKPGAYYSADIVNKTHLNLGRLPIFGFKNIKFEEITDPTDANRDLLNCRILLARDPVQSISLSPVGTNSAGAFGVQGNVIYQNRNIFRGAQLFSVNLSASAQGQGTTGPTTQNSFFNTIELGANVSLTFPQFLFPVRQETIPKRFKPKTSVTLGYDYQKQDDYSRHIVNTTFGYTWNQNERLTHTINPVEISFVKVYPDSSFLAWMNTLTDQSLINQYTDHMVAGMRYTLTYNSQDRSRIKNFMYIRSNFQTGGNLLYGINSLFGGNKSNGSYMVAGVPYSQFVRPDLDIRYYQVFSKTQTMVYRFYGGVGVPYGNTSSLPFEKSFFAGGANDIRGWKMGTLGPGSYYNDTVSGTYNQIGDMQLQVNLEYRFPVYEILRGAIFLDAGNIWQLTPSPDFPGGAFYFNTFLPQVAVDVGIGFRLDFDFFVVRLDPAMQLYVPHYPKGDRFYPPKLQFGDIVWNFGIGYPF